MFTDTCPKLPDVYMSRSEGTYYVNITLHRYGHFSLCMWLWLNILRYIHTYIHAVLHTSVEGVLPGSQYPEGPATGHLGTGSSWFSCVYKRMLKWFPRFQVATACFSCSPTDLNFLDPYFIFMYMHCDHCHRLNILLLLLLSSSISPLWRASKYIILKKTMSLGNSVLQLFWCNYSWCVYC
jgi:hypothetical protein